MRLIGMLDSPSARPVAVSLQLLGLPFEHESVSVFRDYARFAAINPVVKAPTLVCDDGTVLMESSLILDYAETCATCRSLLPGESGARARSLRIVGLALAACEKSVQIVYEAMRPSERQHEAWIERVSGQLVAACNALEAELARSALPVESATIGQDGVSAAVAWHFIQEMVPECVLVARCPT